jgi:hypothetical protein
MRHDLKAILDDLESDVERACEIASVRFNLAVKAKLAEWAERFPRHAFNAWEGHGQMSVWVQPPICGDYQLCLMNPESFRGAIAALIKEAQELVDVYNTERKYCLFLSQDHKTEGWPEERKSHREMGLKPK